MWVVDPEARTLTASRLHVEGSTRGWWELGVLAEDDVARVEPFTELALRCAELWG
jgi:hypothetical protein